MLSVQWKGVRCDMRKVVFQRFTLDLYTTTITVQAMVPSDPPRAKFSTIRRLGQLGWLRVCDMSDALKAYMLAN
jgi:hypothetical protein